MQSTATNVDDYIEELDDIRKPIVTKLRQVILDNLPQGFEETMSYGLIGYVVPLSIYPKGYHVDTRLPLPFAGIGNQRNYVSFYHMGIYANHSLHTWFVDEFEKRTGKKPDLGKSCLRLNPNQPIPYDLIGELIRKISVKDWINAVESVLSKQEKEAA